MVLNNKLNLSDQVELAQVEEKISKRQALEMFEGGFLDSLEPGTYKSLAEIHKYLFSKIYTFAGETRDVNISKGQFRFVPVMYIHEALKTVEAMPQKTFDEIIEKYVETNIVHPFREGNGRSMRIWFDLILKDELSLVIDWSKVDKEDYLLAMERSPIKDIEIKYLLKKATTTDINNRDIYMRGIDTSYFYEGYSLFKMEEL